MTFLPDLPTLLAFIAASLILTITPGPDMTLFIGRTLGEGRAAGFAAMLGAVSGIVVHTCLAAFGISALIAASPQAFLVLKIAGAAYLVFLAFQAIRHGSTVKLETQGGARTHSLAQNWLAGLGINLFNPKIILFFVTFLPQFLTAHDPDPAGKLFFLGLFFIVLALPLTSLMILAADKFARAIRSRPRLTRGLDFLFAVVFSAFAVKILLTQGR